MSTFRNITPILPKLYLDSEIFPMDERYKFSLCKRRLLRENDNTFTLNLKCICCDTYFWNDPGWKPLNLLLNIKIYFQNNSYCLYCPVGQDKSKLICMSCSRPLSMQSSGLQPVLFTPILSLKFYCRHGCGMICFIWELYAHEKICELNNPGKDFKELFKNTFDGIYSYTANDLFVNGNVVEPSAFTTVCGQSPERAICLTTDEGFQCKVYLKCETRDFWVRVEHHYDENEYLTTVRTIRNNYSTCDIFDINNFKRDEYRYIGQNPWCAVIIKKILPNNFVTE